MKHCGGCHGRGGHCAAGGIPRDCNGRALLVGNPNVGKSVLFTHLTGVHALSSNYPGTTVSFAEGRLAFQDACYHLVDVPGAYSLDPINEAEEVAGRIIDEGADVIILVLDATALERNLYLGLQVLERRQPTVVALNMVDEARHQGVEIDVEALAARLGVPVVPTVAVTGEGIRNLVETLSSPPVPTWEPMGKEERWKAVGAIVTDVQQVTRKQHTFRDHLEDISVHQVWGALLGVAVLAGSWFVIRQIGEGLITYLLDPLFSGVYLPLLQGVSAALAETPWLHQLVIGTLFDGAIDFEQSFGLLTTGLYVPLVMVLPYIVAFYSVLSILEDVGYLPRLAVIFDSLMHRVGLHGFAIVPSLLGLGCNVPGVMATRVLESARERFIAATLISVAVPCAGLQAMIVGVVGDYGMGLILLVYLSMAVTWVVLGRLLHSVLPGYSPELVVEIPPYRLPSFRSLGLKLWFRVRGFVEEAVPLVLVGIVIVNLLYGSGAMAVIASSLAPLFETLLGLPPEAAGPILLGILRKDVAVGMLVPLGLTPQQLVVAVVTLAMTFPCIATFVVLWRELGVRRLAGSILIMVATALVAGGILNGIFQLVA
ncbi:MAG: ferrous iron transporter B [Synergistales bacterium]|nr:ferrous iron transporter B [Synergistales bacterium]